MQFLLPIFAVGLALFLNKQESGQNTESTNEDNDHDAQRETGSDNRSSSSRDFSSTTGSQNRDRRVKPKTKAKKSTNQSASDSVETAGKDNDEEQANASSKTHTNPDNDSVLKRQSGVETVESGDAVPDVEGTPSGSTNIDSGE